MRVPWLRVPWANPKPNLEAVEVGEVAERGELLGARRLDLADEVRLEGEHLDGAHRVQHLGRVRVRVWVRARARVGVRARVRVGIRVRVWVRVRVRVWVSHPCGPCVIC